MLLLTMSVTTPLYEVIVMFGDVVLEAGWAVPGTWYTACG